jgi:nucleoside permease NupC
MSFDADPRPTGTLLSDAVNQLTRLVRGEVALAKAEVAQNVKNAGLGIALLVGAVVLVFVALNVLVVALVAALSSIMPAGWASLLVGLVLLGVAGLLAMRGLNALKPENIAPSRTLANVQADAQTIKENVHNGDHKH